MDVYQFTDTAPEEVAGRPNTGVGETVGMEPHEAAEALAAGHLVKYGEWRPQSKPEVVDPTAEEEERKRLDAEQAAALAAELEARKAAKAKAAEEAAAAKAKEAEEKAAKKAAEKAAQADKDAAAALAAKGEQGGAQGADNGAGDQGNA